jgi:alanyl-tRNA synthetase
LRGHEIRRRFLDYFAGQAHRVVRSSSLVPVNDPTLLFTNAGMNQFKDVFLGLEQRDYKRAVSSQKCVRAGGKHNDLENVGFTNRHLTFFEMLGNFSFGDYFKREAIAFAWELITSSHGYGIAKDKLYATVFEGAEGIPRDEEAEQHWLAVGVPRDRIRAFGMKDNFWAMGDTGPCGPCSEIHYDLGPVASDLRHTDCPLGCDCGRFVEIWNLVFMQFNRDASGALTPLPRPCVDTGMGLERLAGVRQGKISLFETDLFMPVIRFAGELTGKSYGEDSQTNVSLRILADHSRAAAFLVSDGVLPSNDGRGYVLRKIIRRALRHGRMLGLSNPFLYQMVGRVAAMMREPYPELFDSIQRVAAVVQHEEERYEHTLQLALGRLDDEIESLAKKTPGVALSRRDDGTAEINGRPLELPGEIAFRLYDTYGLSLDLLEDEGSWRGFRVDRAGFDRAMEEQRARAKASWKGVSKEAANPVYSRLAESFKTEPDFYYGTTARDCRIEAIVTENGTVSEIPAGAHAEIVLDRTAFYAEAGGQLADTGTIYDNARSMELAEVRGAYYPVAGLIAHRIVAKEALRAGDRVACAADPLRRDRHRRNHTATHLMHAALRNILGTHVKQSGSLVAPDHLRFDFTHYAAVDAAALRDIEAQVNQQILRNTDIETSLTHLDDALASGALAFFGDKYPEQNVRVVTILDEAWPRGFYSKELCGGTHTRRTGEVGVFKFVAEQSVAAGIRRVQAITGDGALEAYQRALDTLTRLSAMLNVGSDEVVAAVERLANSAKQLEKQLDSLKRQAAQGQVDHLLGQARQVRGVRVLAATVSGVDRGAMRHLVDTLRQKMGSGVVVLGTAEDGKVALISAVTNDLTGRLHAGKIVQELARQVGGSGGGRPDLAEAGGKDTAALEKAIAHVYQLVEAML